MLDYGNPPSRSTTLDSETDTNGEAHFALSDPVPSSFRCTVYYDWRRWKGSGMYGANGTIDDLIQKGILAHYSEKSPRMVKPKPGEIVFMIRPWSFCGRILARLMSP
jgi:hypothetical protein